MRIVQVVKISFLSDLQKVSICQICHFKKKFNAGTFVLICRNPSSKKFYFIKAAIISSITR